MRRKHLPLKYRNHGLHIWCSTCKKSVTSNPCEHTEKQRYQSRVYNPNTKRQDCIRTYDTQNADEAFELHLAFRRELEATNFNPLSKEERRFVPKFLKEGAQVYFDYLEDVDVPSYARKGLTRQYINDQVRYITRFLRVVQSEKGKVSSFPITQINPRLVGAFNDYISSLNLSDRSYNAHMGAVRYFLDYLIKEYDIELHNPFINVKRKKLLYNPEIITQEEFETFLKAITEEHGIGYKGTKKETVQFYRPWLPAVFKFSLLIGERLDGVVRLKWKDVKDNYIAIPNWKVNRAQKTDVYYSYTPITKDLAELLITLEVQNDPEDFIIQPERANRDSLKGFITKAFSHFWSKSGLKKEVTFKHLRKTYITRMVDLIGEKAKHIKHTNDKTVIKHYLAEKELLSNLRNVRMYEV